MKTKLTPEESVGLAALKDDADIEARIGAIAKRLGDVPHETLCNMFAGFILGGAPSYDEAVTATERMVLLTKHGFDDDKGSA